MQERIIDDKHLRVVNLLRDAEEKIEEARMILLESGTYDMATDLRVERRILRSITSEISKFL
jgi:hypothetical protein